MRKRYFLLTGIILLGLLLRLFILSQRGSFWFDEAFSVHFSSMDASRMLSYLRFENNPPLYFVILHFWMKLAGNSELAVRSLSMVFGVAAIPLIYLLGKRLHSAAAGLFAAFLLAISSFQIFYATETRMYALYLFLALISTFLFIKSVKTGIGVRGESALEAPTNRQQVGWKRTLLADESARHEPWLNIMLFISLLLLTWTHITAWLIVAAFILYLLWQSRFNLKSFFFLHSTFCIFLGLLIIPFLPWGIRFFTEKIAAPASQGWFFYLPPDKNFFLGVLESFLAFGEGSAFIVTLLSFLMAFLLIAAIRTRNTQTMFLLFWLGVPLSVGFAFSSGVLRYFIAVSPAFYLLLGIGFAQLVQQRNHRSFHILHYIFYILFFTLLLPSTTQLAQAAHHRWDALTVWVERMQNAECRMQKCLILVNPHSEVLPFEKYYRGGLPVVGFYPRDDSDDRDLRIVKTNWVSVVTKENIRRLAEVTAGFSRVFLVTGEIDETAARNLVPLWFWENGWRRGEAQEFGRIAVMLLER